MMDQSTYEEYLAFHEAGHAWGFWTVGRRFRYVTLRPRTRGIDAGIMAYRPWKFVDYDLYAFVALCGPLAELRYRIRTDPNIDDDDVLEEHWIAVNRGAARDAEIYMPFMDQLPVNDLPDEINTHWSGIELLAHELLEMRTVVGPRAVEIFYSTAPWAS